MLQNYFMNKRNIDLILSLPTSGLMPISNPSEDHPDNPFYYELKTQGILVLTDTEESGILAVGLTEYGRKLQRELRKN